MVANKKNTCKKQQQKHYSTTHGSGCKRCKPDRATFVKDDLELCVKSLLFGLFLTPEVEGESLFLVTSLRRAFLGLDEPELSEERLVARGDEGRGRLGGVSMDTLSRDWPRRLLVTATSLSSSSA